MATHYRWRQQLIKTLQEGSNIDPAEVDDFQHCTFGQLLTSNAMLKNHPAYQRIQQLHKAFHQEGRRVAELLRQGQRDEARKALLGDSHYNQLTQALAQALDTLASTGGQERSRSRVALQPPKSGKRSSAKSRSNVSDADNEWEEF